MMFPDKGFYYHYKHDPDGSINNYAYKVVNFGYHTEMHDSGEDAIHVCYRPIYEAFVYKQGKLFDIRPLKMFMESVEINGKSVSRFQKITEPHILDELRKIKLEMYGE